MIFPLLFLFCRTVHSLFAFDRLMIYLSCAAFSPDKIVLCYLQFTIRDRLVYLPQSLSRELLCVCVCCMCTMWPQGGTKNTTDILANVLNSWKHSNTSNCSMALYFFYTHRFYTSILTAITSDKATLIKIRKFYFLTFPYYSPCCVMMMMVLTEWL